VDVEISEDNESALSVEVVSRALTPRGKQPSGRLQADRHGCQAPATGKETVAVRTA
jgi:hypothetical protein